MAQEAKYVDLREMPAVPAWEQLIEEVRTTRQPTTIRADGEDVVVVAPAKPARRRRPPKGLTSEDSLWNIVGIGRSEGPTDVSENVDQYLADAYADPHA